MQIPPVRPLPVLHRRRISGQQLDDLFQTWLFTGSRPKLAAAAAAAVAAARADSAGAGSATARARLREAERLRR